jgi:hypothetical protein
MTAKQGRPDMDDTDFLEKQVAKVELCKEDLAKVPELVDKIWWFTLVFSGKKLFKYQEQLGKRIIESVVRADGDEITALLARQSGKTETLADIICSLMLLLPRLAMDPRYARMLADFKDGFIVGVFAPVMGQAETLYDRIVAVFNSDAASVILSDPEIDEPAPKAKGNTYHLPRCRSWVTRMSAHARANIESKTYHLIVIDEAQDADETVVTKSIKPMGAFTGATTVLTGTPGLKKGYFYNAIHRNMSSNLDGKRRNHFQFDWHACAAERPKYAKYVKSEMEAHGQDSDYFRMSYGCIVPETLILTSDLRYVPAGQLREGDKVVGFDEDRAGKGLHRHFREATVTNTIRIKKPCCRITLDDGTEVTASTDHKWLVSTAGSRTLWKRTDELKTTDRIFKVSTVWREAQTYASGYLAAAFEGEGCLTLLPGRLALCFAQKDNVMLEQVRKHLVEFGFQYREWVDKRSGVTKLWVAGGQAAILRFLGQIRPQRLLDKFDCSLLGSIGRHDRGQNFEHPRVTSLEFVGEQTVIPLETSTRTFVAGGLASHNCEWLLERGMFVSARRMQSLADKSMERVEVYQREPCLIGIDVAKEIDSTVVTVVKPDWETPNDTGLVTHWVLNWLEIQGEFEQQFSQIWNFLRPYWVHAIGVDSNGMGTPWPERMGMMFPEATIVALTSSHKAQDQRFNHLQSLIQGHGPHGPLLRWPRGRMTSQLLITRRFYHQMINAEKEYTKQGFLLVHAPDGTTEHDDFPDSLANACILSKMMEQAAPEVEVADNFMTRGSRRH